MTNCEAKRKTSPKHGRLTHLCDAYYILINFTRHAEVWRPPLFISHNLHHVHLTWNAGVRQCLQVPATKIKIKNNCIKFKYKTRIQSWRRGFMLSRRVYASVHASLPRQGVDPQQLTVRAAASTSWCSPTLLASLWHATEKACGDIRLFMFLITFVSFSVTISGHFTPQNVVSQAARACCVTPNHAFIVFT